MSVSLYGNGNTIIQVVSATYGTVITITTATQTDTGLTATITPQSTNSKILVIVSQAGCNTVTASNGMSLYLVRNGTNIQSSSLGFMYTSPNNYGVISLNYLDSPATTSAVTYKTQFARYSGAGQVQVQGLSDTSSITLMEIAYA
jgi:hypothetical protein